MKTISISLYNRPEYTHTLLRHLEKCFGFDEYTILISIDPGDEQVSYLAQEFAKINKNVLVYQNNTRLGCNQNIFVAISRAFSISNYNIHFEDDTIPGRDCLKYFEWADKNYRNNPEIFTISAYVNSNNKTEHYQELSDNISQINTRQWFTPWGWATWADRFEEMKSQWDFMGTNGSWDCTINNIMRKNRKEVYPSVSRTQNIGAKMGTHVPSEEWHAEHHYNEYWIESLDRFTEIFYEK